MVFEIGVNEHGIVMPVVWVGIETAGQLDAKIRDADVEQLTFECGVGQFGTEISDIKIVGGACPRGAAFICPVSPATQGQGEGFDKCSNRTEGFIGHGGVAIALGGDGTVLRALRRFAGTGVPVFGVNYGEIGFLATVEAQPAGEFDLMALCERAADQEMSEVEEMADVARV